MTKIRLMIAAAVVVCAAAPAVFAQSSPSTWGVHMPAGSVSASVTPRGSSVSVQTPVYGVQRDTSYSTTRQHYERSYESHLRGLMAGRESNNPAAGPTRTSTDTTTVGASVGGYGVTRSTVGQPHTRSAAEEALHMHERTAHLRDLQQGIERNARGVR